jgi:hypothetical protein
MKTTLVLLSLLLCFRLLSQDIYFGENIPISLNEKVIFKGNLKIENASNVDFKANSKSKFNQNFEVLVGSIDSDGKFIFENTSEKTIKGNLIVDTISLLSNTKLSIVDAATFQANDLLELNGGITTGNKMVVLGESTGNSGVLNYTAGYINGNMKRWFAPSTISNVLFPFGSPTYYSPATISYTTAPNGGSLTSKYILNSTTVYPINIFDAGDLLENLSGDGFWEINQTDGMSSGTYSLVLKTNNLVGVVDESLLHIVKRPTSNATWGSNWVAEGSHITSSFASGFYTMQRTGLTTFSQFGIASPIINPLPVELVYLNGNCDDNYSLIQWQTASEHNSTSFIIEKSEDGYTWDVIGEVAAAGNSSQLLIYQFKDTLRSTTINYYQLKQYDNDGNFKVYGPVSSNCLTPSNEISVFPNPVVNNCTIKLNALKSGKINISLTDNFGKLIEQYSFEALQGESEFLLDMSKVTTGVYLLNIHSENQNLNQKIIKL